MTDDRLARALLEALRWPAGAICPHCGSDRPYTLTAAAGSSTRPGVWKCRVCRKQFTVTVGTLFHNSHVPIVTWLHAIVLLSTGTNAHQIHRQLGVTYRSATTMIQRLRRAGLDV